MSTETKKKKNKQCEGLQSADYIFFLFHSSFPHCFKHSFFFSIKYICCSFFIILLPCFFFFIFVSSCLFKGVGVHRLETVKLRFVCVCVCVCVCDSLLFLLIVKE